LADGAGEPVGQVLERTRHPRGCIPG
jgi:hypothetical protein